MKKREIYDALKAELQAMIDRIPHQSRAITLNKGRIKAIRDIQSWIKEKEEESGI
jgi:hypothetical protein